MNNFIKTASSAKKHLVTNQAENKPKTANQLSKVEGILTSKIELKYQNNQPYYLAFFAFEGIEKQDIPVIFKIDSNSKNPEKEKPAIPPRAKVLLEGH